jgi:hypothetical protein
LALLINFSWYCEPFIKPKILLLNTFFSSVWILSVRAEVNESGSVLAVDALSQVKHVLLPVLDRNPYLSEGTRQVRLYLENP